MAVSRIVRYGAYPSCVLLAGVVLMLSLVDAGRSANGASPPEHTSSANRPCVVEPHHNADNIDCGVARDAQQSPYFPSRARTSSGSGTLNPASVEAPQLCAGCHRDIYEQWRGSMHANAWNDPIYLALMRASSKATNGLTDKLCLGCHTPIGLTTGEATPSGEKLSELSKNGVQCDFCHNVSAMSGIGNASFVLTPKKYGRPLKFGPFKDSASPYHDTTYSELHTRSELCGTCHNVTHPVNRIPIERTYDEWKDSPYVAEGIGCQECHMSPGPGLTKNPGRAASGGKEREHIYTHYFVGGNSMVASMLGAEQHAGRARDMLRRAAKLELVSVENVRPGATATVVMHVHNTGAGHKLPTGFPEGREIWVDFSMLDERGQPIYRLGRVDAAGRLEEGTHAFKVVLGDDAGNIVEVEVWKASRIIKDSRILPRGYAELRFDVPIPADVRGPLIINANLNYRSFSPLLVKHLLGNAAPQVPTELMASLSRQLPLEQKGTAAGK